MKLLLNFPRTLNRLFVTISFLLCAFVFQCEGQFSFIDRGFNPELLKNGQVNAVALQSDGKVVIGGNFVNINGSRRFHLARLNSDGTVDTSFSVAANNEVSYITIQPDGKILIAGYFSNINGSTPHLSVSRLNQDGSVDSSFYRTYINGTHSLYSIAVQSNGKILIAGNFNNYNGVTRSNLVRLNADGTVDLSFNPGINSYVNEVLVLADGRIVVSGSFTSVNGIGRNRIALLNADGSLSQLFVLSAMVNATSILSVATQSDGKLLIGGYLTYTNNSVLRRNIARLNADGSLDENFVADGTDSSGVVDIKVGVDDKIVACGSFSQFNNVPTRRLVRLNPNGSLDTSFSSSISTFSYLLQTEIKPDGKIIVVGSEGFTNSPAPFTYFSIAQVNLNGSFDTNFNVKTYSGAGIADVETQADGKILVGGEILLSNGMTRTSIVRLNDDGTNDNSFSASTDYYVWDIALQSDGKILVGGRFSRVNGIPHQNFVRFNSNGSLDTSFTTGDRMNGDVTCIKVQPDNKIIVGGSFTTVDGIAHNGIARINPNGSLDTSFNANISPNLFNGSLDIQPDNKILVGGYFTEINGVSRRGIGRLNADGSLDTSFNPVLGGGASVYTIKTQQNQKMVIGGSFTSVNGASKSNVARLNLDGSVDSSFALHSQNPVSDSAIQSDGKIILGGNIFGDGGIFGPFQNGITRLNSDGLTDHTLNRTTFSVLRASPSCSKVLLSTLDGAVKRTVVQNNKILAGGTFSAALYVQPQVQNSIGCQSSSYEVLYRTGLMRFIIKPSPNDFDSDGKTDISIFRPGLGQWWTSRSSDGQVPALAFGTSTDTIVPADYTGDGKTDIAFWRPSTGQWFVLRSEDSSFYALPFGTDGDVPVPTDYDADGKADLAVFRPSNSTWYISRSGDNGTTIQGFGIAGDVPVAADYDGDAKADIAIYRPSAEGGAQWWIQRSSTGVVAALQFGTATDKTVVGDYTGDGKTDIAFWRPSTGFWNILRSEDLSYFAFPFGTTGDVPVPGDYDGDGKVDPGVFRPSSSTWFVQRSTAGTLIQQFGITGDLPLPNAYVR